MDLFAAVHRGFEERLASQRLSARFGRWRSAHEALVVLGDVETPLDSPIARGLDADGVIDEALQALCSASAGLPCNLEAEVVDRHIDAETNLPPPNAAYGAARSNSQSTSHSDSQSVSQSGRRPDRLSLDSGKEQVAGFAGAPMGSATRVHARSSSPRIERSVILASASWFTKRDDSICMDLYNHRVLTTNQLSDLHFNAPRRATTRST